ncbi:MAG: NosD domain-containing protein [Candidatus Cloacimonadia bacterium]
MFTTKKIILYIALTLLALFLISSCSRITENDTVSISGRSILNNDTEDASLDPTDYSGIDIYLYKPITLDKNIKDINYDYPQIGVNISQETEFDHRTSKPYRKTISDSKGHFTFKNIDKGEYILVILKEGWGFRYFHSLQATANKEFLEEAFDLTLYPELKVSGYITDDLEIKSGHHLVFTDHTVCADNSSLTIHSGATIRIAPNANIDVRGGFAFHSTPNLWSRFISNDNIYLTDEFSQDTELGLYYSFNVFGNPLMNSVQLENIIFRNSQNSIKFEQICEIAVKNSVFYSLMNGLITVDCNNVEVVNCLAKGYNTELNIGFYLLNSTNGSVTKNVITNCYSGIKLKDNSNQQVENNLSIGCEYGIELYSSYSIVKHNEIKECQQGLRVCGPTTPKIEYNNIEAETSIIIGHSGYYPNAQPSITLNNLNCRKYYFWVIHLSRLDVDADNNYYFTTNLDTIDKKIYDKKNYVPSVQHGVGTVHYQPIKTNTINDAGINL